MTMLYSAYLAQEDLLAPMRELARASGELLRMVPESMRGDPFVRAALAASGMVGAAALTHERPPFAIESATVAGERVEVREEHALATPFGTLLHFAKESAVEQPKVLVVAPLSGHFATLLRDTVVTMLDEHDVYITDWHNAREVPLPAGRFGFDEYVEHVIDFLHAIGPDSHVLGVCQPAVQALAATAVMSAEADPCVPRSLTLIAGPVDARINPTAVNRVATSHPIEWFERNFITTVPARYSGRGRAVYPGFTQVGAFIGMNPARHLGAFANLYDALLRDDRASAGRTTDFYGEYLAVCDLTAEFYLETVQRVFQEFELAKGTLDWHGQRVDPSAIRTTALLTVEGERDDVCGIGQTAAAHDLASRVPPQRRFHLLAPGVGHYGVFSGRRWERDVYPLVRNVILGSARRPRTRRRTGVLPPLPAPPVTAAAPPVVLA